MDFELISLDRTHIFEEPGLQQDCFDFTIFDDAAVENDEEFRVNLTAAISSVPCLFLSTTVTIIDDDSKFAVKRFNIYMWHCICTWQL